MRTKVYIASPYSNGIPIENVKESIAVADELLDLGYQPFVPLLSHYWHLLFPRDYESWLEYDREWLLACDVVLRTPGPSLGADREVLWAKAAGIPVVYGIPELNAQDWPQRLHALKGR